MNNRLKYIAKRFAPRPLIQKFQALRAWLRCRKARSDFERAGKEPVWLDGDKLESYECQYALRNPQRYDASSTAALGAERAEYLVNVVARPEHAAFLELGCGDGMVGYALRRLSKAAAGIDLGNAFDTRAVEAGVDLHQMDAQHLQFADASYEVVYSYNAFEHFLKPEVVLAEAVRVVRPGGRIYLHFGPLYMSPMGAHLYRQISVPYAHLLWTRDILQQFVRTKGATPLRAPAVNGYTAEDYRRIWKSCRSKLKLMRYSEWRDTAYVNLIERYPSCFRSKTECFDNLVVSSISALFQKME